MLVSRRFVAVHRLCGKTVSSSSCHRCLLWSVVCSLRPRWVCLLRCAMHCRPSVVHCRPSVVYCRPSVVHCRPSVVHCRPSVVHCRPSVVHCRPSVVHCRPSVVHCRPSVVYCRPSVVHCRPSVVHCRPSVVYCRPSVVHCRPSVVHCRPSVVYCRSSVVMHSITYSQTSLTSTPWNVQICTCSGYRVSGYLICTGEPLAIGYSYSLLSRMLVQLNRVVRIVCVLEHIVYYVTVEPNTVYVEVP